MFVICGAMFFTFFYDSVIYFFGGENYTRIIPRGKKTREDCERSVDTMTKEA
jgi:hypothetical protein